jgi:hypothetical protein
VHANEEIEGGGLVLRIWTHSFADAEVGCECSL